MLRRVERVAVEGTYRNDTITGGAGDDTLWGESGGDRLFGSTGDDSLAGGAGADTLIGGAGADTLRGGGDRDVFRFLATSDLQGGRDLIEDFVEGGEDRIDLSAVDANGAGAGNGRFTFLGADAFTGAGAELRSVATVAGLTVVSGDLDGDAQADFTLLLTGTHGLSAADILL